MTIFALHQAVSENMPRRQIGHRRVCILCGCSILRISRCRVLIEGANEEQLRLSAVIASSIQPQELISEDKVCVPCWLRAKRTRLPSLPPQPDIQLPNSPPQPIIQLPNSPEVGEHDVGLMCDVCGHSVSSMIPSGEQLNQENIALLLHHQQTKSMNEVCSACWEQAQHIVGSPETARPQHRPQFITLPNIRRAAETSRHCIFQECLASYYSPRNKASSTNTISIFYPPRCTHLYSPFTRGTF